MERLDAFMARANAAYYATHDPFQDFTTAPEITQVFGELLGAWAAVVWATMGRPDPIILAEAGPGRGTLMQDALRTTAKIAPDFHAAAHVHLIETSSRLRAQQATRLPGATWHDTIDALPPGPMILLANEFLDALPIRQLIQTPAGWHEHHVKDGNLLPLPSGDGRGEGLPQARPGDIIEINEPAQAITRHLAKRLSAQNGAALILDYGPASSAPGDTLQALHNGRPANPLEDPGSRDLTAHVDFEPLAAIAHNAGAAVHGPIQQGPFLARLGLFQRSGALARNQAPGRASALIQAAQRLAEPDRMGGLFKAMAIAHPALPPFARFRMTPLTSAAIATPHGFFTRQGGISEGHYASLNCALSGMDDPAHVAENRDRVRRHLGAQSLVGLHQVHGPAVATVSAPWRSGEGPKADAMVTDVPGIALGIITADCTPVLFHDAAAHVIGAAHAGWRGALAGVLEATVDAMRALGAHQVHASIGPCIRQPSYEVGPDLRDAVIADDPAAARYFVPGNADRFQFDLAAYCAHRLRGHATVDILDADTLADESRFFSHRRRTLAGGHPIGHQISAIVL